MSTAERLRAGQDQILSHWEELVRREVLPGGGTPGLIFREMLPALLDELARALENGAPAPQALREILINGEPLRTAAGSCSIDQVVYELTLLRSALLAVLETSAALPAPDRDIILDTIGTALRTALERCVMGREEAARREAEQHRLLVENAREFGIFLCDLENRVVSWNPGAERITGFTAAEAIGRPGAFIFTPEDRAQGAPEEELRRARDEGRAVDERWHLRKDGSRFWGSGIMEAVYDDDGRHCGFGKVLRDQTRHKQAESERVELLGRLSVLSEVAARLLLTDDPREIVDQVYRRLAAYLDLDIYFNYLIAPDGSGLELNASGGIPAEVAATARYLRFGESVCGMAAQNGKRIVAGNVQQSENPILEIARSLGVTAYACEPLIAGERLIGTLSFGCRRRSFFNEAELQLIEAVGNQVAVALDRSRVLRELAERAEALAAADRQKDEFLAMLAHELRNPLAPILTAMEVMRLRSEDDPRLARSREAVERQVQQMARLLEDLLDVSRITRGKIELRREPVEIGKAVREAVQTSQPWIDAKCHQLSVSLPMTSVVVEADPARLEQILVNLLNNAAKYTDAGGRIWVTAETDGDLVVLRVRDTGRGIPPEMLPYVFDLFTQVETTIDRTAGGLGLGLTLVKRLVELHGGTVAAHSAGPGTGSEFVVWLPIQQLAPESPALKPDARLPASQSLRILVVDDNTDAAHTLADLLELWGHQPEIALDGLAAVALARAFHPEVVLLDIGLPGLDGYAVARRLRGELGFMGTLIAVTGYGQEEDVRRTAEAGFDQHITKPVNPDLLRPLLDRPSPAEP